jgi:hypothetical protein
LVAAGDGDDEAVGELVEFTLEAETCFVKNFFVIVAELNRLTGAVDTVDVVVDVAGAETPLEIEEDPLDNPTESSLSSLSLLEWLVGPEGPVCPEEWRMSVPSVSARGFSVGG